MTSDAKAFAAVDDPIAGADHRHVARLSASSSHAVDRLQEISVRSIHPNPNQPRKHFDAVTLGALADSIRERGLLQPVIVRPYLARRVRARRRRTALARCTNRR